MNTVSEVAKLAGISVRTLHYYDEIGLLRPGAQSGAGYRLYDEADMARLQQILFYRELEFPLADIRRILDSPSFDADEALRQHRRLLLLKRERLDRLIGLVDQSLDHKKGAYTVSVSEFNVSEMEAARRQYAEEARKRWGATPAFRESERRTASYQKEDWERVSGEADEIFRAFAARMGEAPASPEVQELVRQWQEHITRNYYSCTGEILAGLGQMYAVDERFVQNINRFGDGLAGFMSEAIRVFCEDA